jgi:DNA gyrase subunit A
VSEYPRKGRGAMGVKTITLTEKKGGLAGALIVQERDDLVFISQAGMVQRTSVSGISRYGRASQGVKVMNIRDDDQVSAVALVMETSANTSAAVAEELPDVEGDAAAIAGTDRLEGAEAGDIGADDAADAAHGEGASGVTDVTGEGDE